MFFFSFFLKAELYFLVFFLVETLNRGTPFKLSLIKEPGSMANVTFVHGSWLDLLFDEPKRLLDK